MICIASYDAWISISFQSLGDWLTPIMKYFTWLGYPQAYMILIAIIYWSFDRKLGLRMAIFLPVVSSINSILKQAIHAPRPYWAHPQIKAIHLSNGFGMPSGHAQGSTVWLYAASFLKLRWFWALAVTLAIMVGLSRVYLGVHYSSQVLAGWAIGLLIAFLMIRYESPFLKWFLSRKFRNQLVFIFGLSAFILILGGAFVYLLNNWEMPVEWIRNSEDDLAGTGETIASSMGMGAVAGNAGGFLGVALGGLLSHRRGAFKATGLGWKRLLTSVSGLLIFFGLYVCIMLIAPDQAQGTLFSIWRFIGFFLLSFTVIFLVPHLFIRINLLTSSKSSDS